MRRHAAGDAACAVVIAWGNARHECQHRDAYGVFPFHRQTGCKLSQVLISFYQDLGCNAPDFCQHMSQFEAISSHPGPLTGTQH